MKILVPQFRYQLARTRKIVRVAPNQISNQKWFLSRIKLTTPVERWCAIFVLASCIGVLGFLDYLAGINISLVFFYFIPVTLAVVWLGRRMAVIFAMVSVGIRLIGDYAANAFAPLPYWSLWNALSALIILFFMIWVLEAFLALYRQLESRVVERTRELIAAAEARRQLEQELLAAGSKERALIGQELHDDICQHLVGTALAAKVLAQQLDTEKSPHRKEAQAIVGWIEEGAEKTRRLARGLILASIEPKELAEKLSGLVDEAAGTNTACHFKRVGEPLAPDAGTAAQLFRIAQEAMRNALRHSNAARIDITFFDDADAIYLRVRDDGRGLPPFSDRGDGIGLRIMAHRAAFIGAALSITSAEGKGVTVTCRLPVNGTHP